MNLHLNAQRTLDNTIQFGTKMRGQNFPFLIFRSRVDVRHKAQSDTSREQRAASLWRESDLGGDTLRAISLQKERVSLTVWEKT